MLVLRCCQSTTVEADHADRPAVALDHGLEAVVVADLAPDRADEGERGVAVVAGARQGIQRAR